MDILDSHEQSDPSAQPVPGRSRRSRLAAVGLVGIGVVAGGTLATLGVANAGVHSSSAVSSSSTPAPSASPWERHDGRRGFGMGHFGGREIHGKVTVRTGTNTYATLDLQRGTVTSNDGTSITVKSVDGFTATYSFNSSSVVIKNGAKVKVTDVKVGDTVDVRAAEQASGNPVIGAVIDGKHLSGPDGMGRPGDFDGHGPDGQGPSGAPNAPVPSASPSSA